MKNKKNECQERLKQFIKSLKKMHGEGAGLLFVEINFGMRDVRPGDKEYNERTAGIIRQEKHDGNISVGLELFKPEQL